MEEFFIRTANYKEAYAEEGPNPKDELYSDDEEENDNLEDEDIEYED